MGLKIEEIELGSVENKGGMGITGRRAWVEIRKRRLQIGI
jgi:hypothetical protein